jgi:choline-sulfatase
MTSGIGSLPTKPNIVILLNDQDSAAVAETWTQSFEEENLPALKRLKQNGLNFKKAFIGSAACSPSRACFLTSTYPQENGVLQTLGDVKSDDRVSAVSTPVGFAQSVLRPTQLNLGHMLKAAGYKVYWKGKWHLSHPVNGTNTWTDEDVKFMKEAYGFDGWNPSDAGITKIDPQLFGKGLCLHDIRFLEGNKNACVQDADKTKACKQPLVDAESILEFIERYNPEDGPFCLIVSLVNPHDIHSAPHFEPEAGYDEEEFRHFNLPVPANVEEDLSSKPEVHEIRRQGARVGDANVSKRLAKEAKEKLAKANTTGLTQTEIDKLKQEAAELEKKSKRVVFGEAKSNAEIPESRQLFVNFYGYLKKIVDEQMNRVLEAMDEKGLLANTLVVRTSDHGEMCLAHGQREKNYFAYEEVMRVPLVFSHPTLFPTPRETNVLASSLDVLPTLARIVGVYDMFKYAFKGSDLTPLFIDPEAKITWSFDSETERDSIHYASDDGFLPDRFQYTPIYIRTVRTDNWKYSVYFNRLGNRFEYELYNLENDPQENNNLVGVARYFDKQQELHTKLQTLMIKMGTVPTPYWIYTEAMQKTSFVPPQYWPTSPEAVLGGRMQYEANKAQQKFRRSTLIQSQVNQVPADLWWVG